MALSKLPFRSTQMMLHGCFNYVYRMTTCVIPEIYHPPENLWDGLATAGATAGINNLFGGVFEFFVVLVGLLQFVLDWLRMPMITVWFASLFLFDEPRDVPGNGLAVGCSSISSSGSRSSSSGCACGTVVLPSLRHESLL